MLPIGKCDFRNCGCASLLPPAREVRGHEGVVGEVGIRGTARSMARSGPGSASPRGRGSGSPASRPWRRSTSWQPAMQPAKSLATSKKAALQSVTMRIQGQQLVRDRAAATAALDALEQRPRPAASRPTSGRAGRRGSARVTGRSSRMSRTGATRSATIWSSLPV